MPTVGENRPRERIALKVTTAGSRGPQRTTKPAWTLLLLVPLFVLSGSQPASAQSQVPPAGTLDLNPVLQLVCNLTTLLCPPPAPSTPPPATPSTVTPEVFVRAPEPSSDQVTIPALPPQGLVVPGQPAPTITQPLLPPAGEPAPRPALPAPAVPRGPAGPSVSAGAGRTPGPALVLPRPAEVDLSPRTVAIAAGVSLFGLILIGFPAELFNKTLRENYDRIRSLIPRLGSRLPTRRRAARFWLW